MMGSDMLLLLLTPVNQICTPGSIGTDKGPSAVQFFCDDKDRHPDSNLLLLLTTPVYQICTPGGIGTVIRPMAAWNFVVIWIGIPILTKNCAT